MPTILEMRDVQKTYGRLHVLKDFDLAVDAGEFVTFLGPSGSGKTTALKLIAGFEAPSAGDIRLEGRSIVELPPYARGIGMVFQNYALFPHMTVAENVAFPLSVRKVPRAETEEKVASALELIRMGPYRERYPSQLSGGQQQRVALARAICFGPRLLLMDEPLGALDRNLRDHMKIEIMRIQKELGITVVFVTHDQDEALTMSDRIAVINEGRLVQMADGRGLYNRPANRFVASFVGESNLLRCRVEAVEDDVARVRIDGHAAEARHTGQRAGDEAWLLVRPEHVSIAAPGASPAGLRAEVEQALFLGEATRYAIRWGDLVLTAKQQNRDDAVFREGEPVTVSWRGDRALLLE